MSDEKLSGIGKLLSQRPDSIEQLIDEMSTNVYDSLKLALELGKWEDGSRLDEAQRDFCMQAIILYEAKNLPEQDRIGFDLSASCKSKGATEKAQTISLDWGVSPNKSTDLEEGNKA